MLILNTSLHPYSNTYFTTYSTVPTISMQAKTITTNSTQDIFLYLITK